ncbi:MAG: MmgE/PrpD family protein, partial [Myxococcales bacterium]|nr:MmgE/PrpD family protein [Myxococcales bacterium]
MKEDNDMTRITRELAEFVAGVSYDGLPAEVVDRTKMLVMDLVGIALRARHDADSTPSLFAAVDRLGLALSIEAGWLKLASGPCKVDAACGLDAPGLWIAGAGVVAIHVGGTFFGLAALRGWLQRRLLRARHLQRRGTGLLHGGRDHRHQPAHRGRVPHRHRPAGGEGAFRREPVGGGGSG